LLLLDRRAEDRVVPLVSRVKFWSLEVFETLGIVVCIVGKKRNLVAYKLNDLLAHVHGPVVAGAKLQQSIGDLDHVQHFFVAKYERMKFMCVCAANKIIVFLWASRPFNRFMLYKEFVVPIHPIIGHIRVTDDDNIQIVFGTKGGFHVLDVISGAVLNLHVPPGKADVAPISIMQLPPGGEADILLCYNDKTVKIDVFGDTIETLAMGWQYTPAMISLAYSTQLISFAPGCVEIRDFSNNAMDASFQHKHALRLTYLCARNNRVFFASVKSSPQCEIFFMTF
jgi:hypothetical protein